MVLLLLLLLISLHGDSRVHGLSTDKLPFVLLHGISDSCLGSETLWVQRNLENSSGVKGICVEIGNGFDSSWYMNMWLQVDEACQKISDIPDLSNGFNLVGLSQGSLIARAVIQTCDTLPRVHNFLSIGGPQAGVASVPLCLAGNFSGMCRAADALLRWAAYTPWLQKTLAPAGYFKIPTALDSYYIGCRFLPNINNEIVVNSTYSKRLKSLRHIAFVMVSWALSLPLFLPPYTAAEVEGLKGTGR